jgi:hypothetical protein
VDGEAVLTRRLAVLSVLLRVLLSLAPNPLEIYYLGLLQRAEDGGPTLAEAKRDYQDYLHSAALV